MMSEHAPGTAPSSPPMSEARVCRSLKLAWTDPRSGEQLIVSLKGGSNWVAGLAGEGFRVLDEVGEPADGERRRAAAGLPEVRGANGRARP